MHHLLRGRIEVLLERSVEVVQDARPVEVLLLDLVELLLHVPGEGDVHDLGEELVELVRDDFAQIGGVELAVLLLDVLRGPGSC